MTAYENLLYEKQRNGLLITLNRPDALNALSQGLRDEIDAALEEARQDPDIRAVVLTGAGRAFRRRGHRRRWRWRRDGMGLALRHPRRHVPDGALRRLEGPGPQQHRKPALPVGVPQAYHRRDQRVVPGRRLMAGPHLPHDHRRR